MSDESEDGEQTAFKKRRPFVDGKTVVIGGGVLALIAFLFFRKGGGSGGNGQPLLFKLRSDGLWLGNSKVDVTAAIGKVFASRKNEMVLQTAGDVPQGVVDTFIEAFNNAGIKVYQKQPQSIASVYQRGLGGNIA